MDPKAMVRDAEALAQALIANAKSEGLNYSELIQILEISMRLLKATFPGTHSEVFDLTQLANAQFEAIARTPEDNN